MDNKKDNLIETLTQNSNIVEILAFAYMAGYSDHLILMKANDPLKDIFPSYKFALKKINSMINENVNILRKDLSTEIVDKSVDN